MGGYIWAPIVGRDGKGKHHWDSFLEVREGDIILHGNDAKVVAASIAQGPAQECPKPDKLDNEQLWEKNGRKVDCEYHIFARPIKTVNYKEDILRYCRVKYAPFDKDGNGNMGYLFEVNPRLAKVFLEGAEAANPKDEAIKGILEGVS